MYVITHTSSYGASEQTQTVAAVTSLSAEDRSTIQDALAQISAGVAMLQPYLASVNGSGQATPPAETLLSRAQVARRWNVSTETVKPRERVGILPSVRFNGRNVRYRLVDVERVEQRAESVIRGS
jgi:hypothetical protein